MLHVARLIGDQSELGYVADGMATGIIVAKFSCSCDINIKGVRFSSIVVGFHRLFVPNADILPQCVAASFSTQMTIVLITPFTCEHSLQTF